MLPATETAENKAVNFKLFRKRTYDRVLELAPYDGVDTIALHPYCKHIVAIEGRQRNCDVVVENLKKANIKLGEEVFLVRGNLELIDLALYGRFDCVWASGILYHLVNPKRLIRQITLVTKLCYGWTHLSLHPPGHFQPEETSLGLAGLSIKSWWFAQNEFLEAWSELGWTCRYTTEPSIHPNSGLAAQFIATKD